MEEMADAGHHRDRQALRPGPVERGGQRHDVVGLAVDDQRRRAKFLGQRRHLLRQLALAHVGLVCLSDFMTAADRERGRLVQVLARDTVEVRQPINAVYYRNTQLAARIAWVLDFLQERMGG